MKTDIAYEQSVSEFVFSKLFEWQEKRAPYSWRWAELMRYYMNYINTEAPPGMDWMHTEMRQDAFDLIEGYIPHVNRQSFNRNAPPIVNAHTKIGEEVQLGIQEGLMLALRRSGLERMSGPAMRMLGICGHITSHNYWHM